MKREQIRDQLIVFDELALFIAHVLCNYLVAAEGNPLHEMVEALVFGRRRLNRVS